MIPLGSMLMLWQVLKHAGIDSPAAILPALSRPGIAVPIGGALFALVLLWRTWDQPANTTPMDYATWRTFVTILGLAVAIGVLLMVRIGTLNAFAMAAVLVALFLFFFLRRRPARR